MLALVVIVIVVVYACVCVLGMMGIVHHFDVVRVVCWNFCVVDVHDDSFLQLIEVYVR